MDSSQPQTAAKRKRAGSVKQMIASIETDPHHHLAGPFNGTDTPPSEVQGLAVEPKQRETIRRTGAMDAAPSLGNASRGLWNDITSLHWTRVPSSALFLVMIPIVLYLNWELLSPGFDNPFKYLLMIQYRVPDATSDVPLYRKGPGDVAFLLYYVIVFCFIRQTFTIHIFRPLAVALGIRKEAKIDRFTEQAYAIVYFTASGTLGLLAMSKMDTWYFNGENFWKGYPFWKMSGFMKSYYLLQFSYWLQQFLILVLQLEKPRKDFKSLAFHHVVTLYLIFCSYWANHTPLGNAVFICMDVSDIFLSLSKTLNYLKLEKTSAASFAFFVGVWTYTRHYLSLYILWSVYYQFDLIPTWAKVCIPSEGLWQAPAMKHMIFIPLLMLQAVNLFWYFLIWRILVRALFSNELNDDRSDDEDDGLPNVDDKDE